MNVFKLMHVKSITGKIIILMLLIELFIFSFLGLYIYVNSEKIIKSEVIKSETQLLDTVSTSIEDDIYSCVDETIVISEDSFIIGLTGDIKSQINISDKKDFYRFVSRKMDFNRNISSIIVSNGIYTVAYPEKSSSIPIANIKEYVKGKSIKNTLDTGCAGIEVCKVDIAGTNNKKPNQWFMVFKRQGKGFIAVVLKNSFLTDINKRYDHFAISKNKDFFRYDVKKSAREYRIPSKEYFDLLHKDDNSWNRIKGFNGLIYKKHFYSIGADFFCALPERSIEYQVDLIAEFIVIAFLAGILFFFFVSFLVLHGLNKPLTELRSFIDSVDISGKRAGKFYSEKVGFLKLIVGETKLKNRLYIVLVLCTTIPIVIVSLFAYYKSSSVIEKRLNETNMRSVEIASDKVGNIFDSYKRLTKNVMSNLEIQKLVIGNKAEGRAVNGLKGQPKIGSQGLGPPTAAGTDISYIVLREQVSNLKFVNLVLFDKDINILYSMIPPEMVDGIKQLVERYSVPASSGKPVWTEVTYDRAWDYRFSILWEVRGSYPETGYGKKIGYVLATFTLQDIERKLDGILRENNGDIYILDSKNKYFVNANHGKINKLANVDIKKCEGKSSFYYRNDKNATVYVSSIPGTDLRIIAEMPSSKAYGKAQTFYISSVLLLLICILVVLFVSREIANHFVDRIVLLEKIMKNVEEGDLSIRYHGNAGDEISALGISFNRMLERIQELVVELAAAATKEKELESQRNIAELKALHAQINPHFLYNTLESINSLAMIKGVREISNMAVSLGNMFRFSVKSGNNFVLFKEEISHVESYLKIQKIRYSDLFKYNIKIDPLIYDCYCVKLILQPIVENAIYHGVEKKGGGGLINIIGELFENRIKISIIDNGSGIRGGKLDEINKKLKEAIVDNAYGIGLFNVNRRIKLLYGDEYGLKVYSIEGEETRVEIWLPVSRNIQ